MTLLAIILALVAERWSGRVLGGLPAVWLKIYLQTAQSWLGIERHSLGGVLAIFFPPLILVGFLQWWLASWLWGIPALLFCALVLLLCMQSMDDESLYVEDPYWTFEETRFGIWFWFVVLGPLGAVWVRLIPLWSTIEPTSQASPQRLTPGQRMAGILHWLPTRLAGLGFALCGRFGRALEQLLESLYWADNLDAHNRNWLARMGSDASGTEAPREVIKRSQWLWLAVLGLLSLGDWIS